MQDWPRSTTVTVAEHRSSFHRDCLCTRVCQDDARRARLKATAPPNAALAPPRAFSTVQITSEMIRATAMTCAHVILARPAAPALCAVPRMASAPQNRRPLPRSSAAPEPCRHDRCRCMHTYTAGRCALAHAGHPPSDAGSVPPHCYKRAVLPSRSTRRSSVLAPPPPLPEHGGPSDALAAASSGWHSRLASQSRYCTDARTASVHRERARHGPRRCSCRQSPTQRALAMRARLYSAICGGMQHKRSEAPRQVCSARLRHTQAKTSVHLM